MSLARRVVFGILASAPLLAALPVRADTTVTVTLWDRAGAETMPDGLGHGMGGDASKATMGIDLSADTVSAGRVVFDAVNDSKDIIHEMIVAPLKSADDVLPYDAADARVKEDEAGHLGEVAELDPGASGQLGLDLKPGTYILYCNLPGHYMAGMWATLTVTE